MKRRRRRATRWIQKEIIEEDPHTIEATKEKAPESISKDKKPHPMTRRLTKVTRLTTVRMMKKPTQQNQRSDDDA